MTRRLASIDLGSNSVVLLIADLHSDGSFRVVDEQLRITGMSLGIQTTGRPDPRRIGATIEALAHYRQRAQGLGAEQLQCVATAGLRDYPEEDRAAFLSSAASWGVEIELIDGDREAALSTLAVQRSLPELGDDFRVVDVGGRSTEVVEVKVGDIRSRHSLELGSVALSEVFLGADPPGEAAATAALAQARAVLGAAPGRAGPALAAVGGTATTLLSMQLELEAYEPERIHGGRLDIPMLEGWVSSLSQLPVTARQQLPGLQPQRADVILGGAITLLAALQHLHADEALISNRGLCWGVLYALASSA